MERNWRLILYRPNAKIILAIYSQNKDQAGAFRQNKLKNRSGIEGYEIIRIEHKNIPEVFVRLYEEDRLL